jgi:glycosyltransferase involved in cell wall biosynthesis
MVFGARRIMPKRLKIVQVMASSNGVVGGVEKHTFELCNALAQKHEVHLIADKSYAAACDASVVFHAINFKQSRFNPFLYLQLFYLINHLQPQIIHAQAGKAASLLRWFKWLFKHVVFVATVHGTKKNIRAYAAMDGVIAVSSQLAANFSADKVRVIYNGSKPAITLKPNEKKRLKKQLLCGRNLPLLMAVGRLAPVKAFDVLLHAFVGVEAYLVIVGDGDERQNLEQLCEHLGLRDKVLFLGHRQDVGQLLQVADLCVISSHREGFPLVMVEALQTGCLVVATEVSGVKEWLSPALLTPSNDVEGLHDLLCATLARLPSLHANYLPIFLRARQELTIEGMAQRTEEFYYDLLEQHT